MKECFECGATEDIQEHHVVPRLRGGTKTVPLCYSCHCRAHGRDSKGLEHSRLVKEGIQKAFERDPEIRANWGAARRPKQATAVMNRALVKKADSFAMRVGPIAAEMRAAGKTLQQTAETLMDSGIKTARGGEVWTPTAVKNLVERYKKLLRRNNE